MTNSNERMHPRETKSITVGTTLEGPQKTSLLPAGVCLETSRKECLHWDNLSTVEQAYEWMSSTKSTVISMGLTELSTKRQKPLLKGGQMNLHWRSFFILMLSVGFNQECIALPVADPQKARGFAYGTGQWS
jgi:hypothetical protein